MERPPATNIGEAENKLADNELLESEHADKPRRNRRKTRGGRKTPNHEAANEAEEADEIDTTNVDFSLQNQWAEKQKLNKIKYSDHETIEPITEVEAPTSRAESKAKLAAVVSEFAARNSIVERVSNGGRNLDAVRERLNLKEKKGPLNLERSFDEEAKPLSAVEVAEQANQKYLDAYRAYHSKKNEFLGLHVKGGESLKKLEAEMLAARRQSLVEREAIITDPAERARLRREEAKELIQLKSQARIEAAQEKGRWDHELFDDTIGAWGRWNKGMEDKYGKWKVRTVRAAVFTGLATGVAVGTGAVTVGFAALGAYGAWRLARTLARSPLMQGIGSIYKNTIGEKQRTKSEKRLDKLDVHGDLSDESYRDFMKRFEKNYNRAQASTLQAKMKWVGAAAALALTAGVGYEAVHEIHEHFGGGGHGGGGHGGGPHGKPPAAAHPVAGAHQNHAPTQAQHAVEAKPQAPSYEVHPTKLSIGAEEDGVKINDADRLLGHFADKLRANYPDMSKAPDSVRNFLKDFDPKNGESMATRVRENYAARLMGFDNKNLILHNGDSIELDDKGQVIFKWANAKDALHAPHVIYDNDHDSLQPTDDFEQIAKQHASSAHEHVTRTEAAGGAAVATHHAVENQPQASNDNVNEIMRNEAAQSRAQIEAHEKLVEEQAKLRQELQTRPNPSDPNFDRWNHMFEDHKATLQKHIDAYNKKFSGAIAPTETTASSVETVPAPVPEHVTPSHEQAVSESNSIARPDSYIDHVKHLDHWSGFKGQDADKVFAIPAPAGQQELTVFRNDMFNILRQSGVGPHDGELVADYIDRASKAIENHAAGTSIVNSHGHLIAQGGDLDARIALAQEFKRLHPDSEVFVHNPEGNTKLFEMTAVPEDGDVHQFPPAKFAPPKLSPDDPTVF